MTRKMSQAVLAGAALAVALSAASGCGGSGPAATDQAGRPAEVNTELQKRVPSGQTAPPSQTGPGGAAPTSGGIPTGPPPTSGSIPTGPPR